MAQDIIASRMTALGHAADALLERETLTGQELSDILSRFPASQPPADLQSYIVRALRSFNPLMCSPVWFCARGYAGCCTAESSQPICMQAPGLLVCATPSIHLFWPL